MIDPSHRAPSPQSVGIDPAKLEALFARAGREVQEGLLPSAQIAVARGGRVAGMRSFGTMLRGGRETPATDDTLYVVFSATKAIVSAAAWLLIEEGKLDLDERVADVVPEFATNGKESVRVWHLFTHTAGFPQAPYPQHEWHDRAQRLARFASWRLVWEPGTRFEYHPTSGLWVIAELIERRAGVDYRDFVRSRIAEPLGLPDLRVGLPRAHHDRVADLVHVGAEMTEAERRALGFPEIPKGEITEEALQNFNRAEVREAGAPGAGGIMGAAELALFYQALLRDGGFQDAEGPGRRVWGRDTVRSALEIRTGELRDPIFRQRANRALGVVVSGGAERVYLGFGRTGSERMFGHNGAGGQIAFADPATGISVGYCTNGFDRNELRSARRSVALASRAAELAL